MSTSINGINTRISLPNNYPVGGNPRLNLNNLPTYGLSSQLGAIQQTDSTYSASLLAEGASQTTPSGSLSYDNFTKQYGDYFGAIQQGNQVPTTAGTYVIPASGLQYTIDAQGNVTQVSLAGITSEDLRKSYNLPDSYAITTGTVDRSPDKSLLALPTDPTAPTQQPVFKTDTTLPAQKTAVNPLSALTPSVTTASAVDPTANTTKLTALPTANAFSATGSTIDPNAISRLLSLQPPAEIPTGDLAQGVAAANNGFNLNLSDATQNNLTSLAQQAATTAMTTQASQRAREAMGLPVVPNLPFATDASWLKGTTAYTPNAFERLETAIDPNAGGGGAGGAAAMMGNLRQKGGQSKEGGSGQRQPQRAPLRVVA